MKKDKIIKERRKERVEWKRGWVSRVGGREGGGGVELVVVVGCLVDRVEKEKYCGNNFKGRNGSAAGPPTKPGTTNRFSYENGLQKNIRNYAKKPKTARSPAHPSHCVTKAQGRVCVVARRCLRKFCNAKRFHCALGAR
jgi:hypothetical protein